MPAVLPIKDLTTGCMSNFLVDHHKAPTEIKVKVARIRWSSCKYERTIHYNFYINTYFKCESSKYNNPEILQPRNE